MSIDLSNSWRIIPCIGACNKGVPTIGAIREAYFLSCYMADVPIQRGERRWYALVTGTRRGVQEPALDEWGRLLVAGMTHADKLLMFGDGSYGAASTPAFKLQPFKMMKAPTVVKVSPMKNVVKVKLAPMRSPLSGLSGLGGLMGSLKPAMTASKPVVARVKPMVVLVRPMSSNRMPNGGKGPTNAARPVPIAKWFASMWGGG